jgi:hypothetical protein
MSKITWVARRDGFGWSSLRTRDAVDLAFSVDRAVNEHKSEVTVRCTWHNASNARARRTIGRFYFDDDTVSKAMIQSALEFVNMVFTPAQKEEARIAFLNMMLIESLPEGAPGKKSFMYPYAIINDRYVTEAGKPPIEKEEVAEMVSKLAESFSVAEEVINKVEEPVKPIDITQFKPGDPAPAGYIWMGKELMQISWPS